MKSEFYIVKKLVFIFLIALFVAPSYGCHFSWMSINSITDNGSSYTIELSVSLGGGILGATVGADNSTTTFALGAFGDGMTTVNLLSYSPSSVTSDSTSCTNPANTFTGAFGADSGILYLGTGCNFMCVSSTAACGRPHNQVLTITLEFNVLPQSIQAFGLEGAGNPVAGCYGNANTIVYPLLFLPLEWGEFDAFQEGNHVEFSWVESSICSLQRLPAIEENYIVTPILGGQRH